MIRLKKSRVFAILCFTAMALGACGKRTEAVISDGEDITELDITERAKHGIYQKARQQQLLDCSLSWV